MQVTVEGTTVRLVGQFDGRSTAEVRDTVYGLMATHPDAVVVDLTDVEAIDLTALRVLVVATANASRRGVELVLRDPRPPVRRMLHLSRLRQFVRVEGLRVLA